MLETTTNTASVQVWSTAASRYLYMYMYVCILALPSDVNKCCLPLRVALFSRLEEIAGGRLLTHDVARRLITLASV